MASPRFNGSKWIRPAKRRRIYARDDNCCVYCGSAEPLTLDHVVPRAAGGCNDPSNLLTACRECNTTRGTLTVWEFVRTRFDVVLWSIIFERIVRCIGRELPPAARAKRVPPAPPLPNVQPARGRKTAERAA